MTVQAPHSPTPQQSFAPLSLRSSRRKSSSVTWGRISRETGWPFTVRSSLIGSAIHGLLKAVLRARERPLGHHGEHRHPVAGTGADVAYGGGGGDQTGDRPGAVLFSCRGVGQNAGVVPHDERAQGATAPKAKVT